MIAVHFPWILADFESFVGVIFMIVAFIGWIVNLAGQQKQGGPPQRKAVPPRPPQDPKTIQSEIEKFLSQSQQSNPQAPAPGSPLSSDGVEVIERPRPQTPRRAPPVEKRQRTPVGNWEEPKGGNRPAAQPARQIRRAPPPAAKPASAKPVHKEHAPLGRPSPYAQIDSATASAALPPHQIGEERQRIGAAVRKDLAPQIAAGVSAHLGAFQTASGGTFGERAMAGTTTAAETPARRLAQLMRSRNSIRDAILLSEIMAKPRVLRQ